jgi:hypothetical protein
VQHVIDHVAIRAPLAPEVKPSTVCRSTTNPLDRSVPWSCLRERAWKPWPRRRYGRERVRLTRELAGLASFPDCRRASGGNPTVGRTPLVRKRGTHEGNGLRRMGWHPTRPNLAIHSWTPRGLWVEAVSPDDPRPYLGWLGIQAMRWARNVTHDAKMVYLSHAGCYRSRDRSRERSLVV